MVVVVSPLLLAFRRAGSGTNHRYLFLRNPPSRAMRAEPRAWLSTNKTHVCNRNRAAPGFTRAVAGRTETIPFSKITRALDRIVAWRFAAVLPFARENLYIPCFIFRTQMQHHFQYSSNASGPNLASLRQKKNRAAKDQNDEYQRTNAGDID
jgi:hypothetical protein